MATIIRSITNNTSYTLTLKVPSLEQNLSPVTIASHATLDLLTVVTEDELLAMQLYLRGMVSRGNLSIAATMDLSVFTFDGVLSLHADSSSQISGDVHLISGTNVTLSQTGNAITVSASSSSSPASSIVTASTPPGSPVEGQIFYNTTTHQAELWNGTSWVIMG